LERNGPMDGSYFTWVGVAFKEGGVNGPRKTKSLGVHTKRVVGLWVLKPQ